MRGLTAEEARILELIARYAGQEVELGPPPPELEALEGVHRVKSTRKLLYATDGIYVDIDSVPTPLGRLALQLYRAGIR